MSALQGMYDDVRCSGPVNDKVISIGYSVKLLVPGCLLAQTVELLQNLQQVEGYGATETLKPIEFEVKIPDPNLGVPISDREKRLAGELEKKNSEWATAYNKANALEKELKELKASRDD